MNAQAKVATPAALTIQDCKVTGARGHETRHGIAFSGLLWVRDRLIASFRNDGRGGCNHYQITPGCFEAFAEFKELAVRQFSDVKFEQEDQLAGAIWDDAYLSNK